MFARRAGWNLEANELMRRVEARRAAGLSVLDLCAANPTDCGLTAAARLLHAALEELPGDPRAVRYAPDPKGDADCRRAIAAYHSRTAAPRGSVDPEHVLLTAGTSEAYAHLFRLLGDPGDAVLVPSPSYPLFELLAGLEGLTAVPYPLRLHEGVWRIDFAALEALADERARALLVVHPNNPTGSFVRDADAVSLRKFCEERRLALVSDEVFADYAFGPRGPWPASLLDLADAGPLRFVLSGASKVVALPQLKVAWIVTAGPASLRDEAVRRLEVVADAYLSVSGPAQLVLPRLLAGRAEVQAELGARLAVNRRTLSERLASASGVSALPADGGWYTILRINDGTDGPPDEDALVAHLLDGPGVLAHPGWFFDLDSDGAAHLVLSLLPEPGVFARGLEAIVRQDRR